jgi:hypothetical protein
VVPQPSQSSQVDNIIARPSPNHTQRGEMGPSIEASKNRVEISAHLLQVLQEIEYDHEIVPHRSKFSCASVDVTGSVYEPHHNSFRSKFFWRMWASSSPNITAKQLYAKGLEHGARVTHRVLVADLQEHLPHRLPLSAIPVQANPSFSAEMKIAAYNIHYVDNVKSLLSGPIGRVFLERGGLAWRLALEFGERQLWEDVFKGPSSLCVHLGKGERHDSSYISDAASASEYKILTGSIYSRDNQELVASLFPPVDLFEASKHWIGVWTTYNEAWFRNLVKSLFEGELKPQPASAWKRNMRSNRKTLSEDDAKIQLNIVDNLISY